MGYGSGSGGGGGGSAIGNLFGPLQWSTRYSSSHLSIQASGITVYTNMVIPSDFDSLDSMKARIILNTGIEQSVTVNHTVNYGSDDEAHNARSETFSGSKTIRAAGKITELDVTDQWDAVDVDDVCGATLQLVGVNVHILRYDGEYTRS